MTWRYSLVRFVMAMVAGKTPPASTLSPAHNQDGFFSPRKKRYARHCLNTFTRSKSSLSMKIYNPSVEEIVDNTGD